MIPRRPLNPSSFGATGIVIDQPGSYYLTGNVTTVPGTVAAINVQASSVTIDLRGFTLITAGGVGSGAGNAAIIAGVSQSNVTVRNGSGGRAFMRRAGSARRKSCEWPEQSPSGFDSMITRRSATAGSIP